MKKAILFLIFILSLPLISGLKGADFAVYTGSGTWQPSITAFENFLKWKGLTYEEISAWDINNKDLRPLYKAIFMPGGWAYDYKKSIKSSGNQHIKDLIANGGAYIGMSAGAYYACDNVRWEGVDYIYYLKLFHGDCIGPIPEIAPWPDYIMTTLSINKNHEANIFEPETEDILYYGEPYFVPYSGQEMQVFASWNVPLNLPADKQPGIIGFNYGNGRVLLVGPHPEIEEDSNRDGTNFADEFDDKGSDWPFLWTATDWLLKRQISQPPELPFQDTTTPVISMVSDSPDPLNSGEILKIEANVADNVAVSSVWVEILGSNHTMSLNQGYSTILFYEDFESGNVNAWTTTAVSGGNKWTVSTTNPYQGTYHAQSQPMSTSEPASIIEKAFSTSSYENIKLSYYRKLVGLDIADEFKAKWFDGTTWTILEQTGSNSANDAGYVYKEFSLPSLASNNVNFAIKFECTAGAVSEYCRVDNVKVTANTQGTGLYEYFYNTVGLNSGAYEYTVKADDTSGNQAIPLIGSFSVV